MHRFLDFAEAIFYTVLVVINMSVALYGYRRTGRSGWLFVAFGNLLMLFWQVWVVSLTFRLMDIPALAQLRLPFVFVNFMAAISGSVGMACLAVQLPSKKT